ncbi:MAG: DMT family transporter [Trueperaceae bacterium]
MTVGVAVLLVVQMILWGTAFPMIKIALVDLTPPHLTLLRHLVASAAFVPLLLAFKARLLPRRADVPFFLLLGFVGYTVYHLSLNYGQTQVSAGAASLIIATAPAITALLAVVMVGERLPLGGWIGSAISFVGVVLIVLGDSGGSGLTFNVFAWLIVLGAISTSFYAILQRRLFDRYRPIEVAAFATWAGTLPMLVFVPGVVADVAAAGAPALLATIYIGVFPSAVAYTIFAFALSRVPVTMVAAALYMVPVFSLIASWLLVGEVPGPLTVVGGAVAIGGIVLLNVAKQRAGRVAARAART